MTQNAKPRQSSTKDDPTLLTMVIESIQETKTGVNVLYDIVCKGHDGQQSLLARISILERSEKDCDERVSELEKFQIQFKIEDQKTKRHLLYLLVVSIIGWLTAIVTNVSSGEKIKWFIDIIK